MENLKDKNFSVFADMHINNIHIVYNYDMISLDTEWDDDWHTIEIEGKKYDFNIYYDNVEKQLYAAIYNPQNHSEFIPVKVDVVRVARTGDDKGNIKETKEDIEQYALWVAEADLEIRERNRYSKE